MRKRPPSIDGLAASTLQLPQGAWPAVLDCLCERFPAVARSQWLERMARGRVYEAIAPALPHVEFPCTRSSRMVAGEPFFRMQEIEGPTNSETRIDVVARGDGYWRYMLTPITGRKHQLRVHMAALGAPIVNDGMYPSLFHRAADDYSAPLQLLAKRLLFVDPLSGVEREFCSDFLLSCQLPKAFCLRCDIPGL